MQTDKGGIKMKKRLLPSFAAVCLLLAFWSSSAFAAEAWEVRGVDYADIDTMVDECISSSAADAVSQMQDTSGSLNTYAENLRTQLATLQSGTDASRSVSDQLALVTGCIESLGVSIGTVENQMGGQSSPNNSIIIGAKTLFITYNSLRDQLNSLSDKQRLFSANESNEKQLHASGYIGDLAFEQYEEQGSSIQSSIQSLQLQMNAVKRSFNTLLGRSYSQGLDLHSLPFTELNAVSSMGFKDDLDSALGNYTGDTTGKNFSNPDYDADKGSFAASFKKLYDTVQDKNNQLLLEEQILATQQKSFDAAGKQYAAGLMANLDYLSAQNQLNAEAAKVKAAKTALFTSYEQYEWAVNYGIINNS
jgi:hypothetical protein